MTTSLSSSEKKQLLGAVGDKSPVTVEELGGSASDSSVLGYLGYAAGSPWRLKAYLVVCGRNDEVGGEVDETLLLDILSVRVFYFFVWR